MKSKQVISAIVGGAFFAIPYIGLSLGIAPALAIGVTAFTASELVLSGVKEKENLISSFNYFFKLCISIHIKFTWKISI